MNEVSTPLGWKQVRLGDVAKTASGGTPKRTVSAYYGGEIPWVKSGELGDSTVYQTEETISKAGLDASSAKIFPKGTLCIALYGATVGKLGILGVDAATNQAVCGVFLPESIDTRFAYRFLESKRRDLVEMGKGGAQSNISQEIIRDLKLPMPSLDEQREIVAEIEKQFTRLEAGVAGLRRVQANLKRYRASVLKAACEGKLVPTEAELARQEGRSYETGAQLLDRILTERRQKWNGKGKYKEPARPGTKLPPLPEGWSWASLESIANALGGYAFESKKFCDSGFQVLKMANVRMGRIDLSQRPSFIAEVDQEIVNKYKLLDGDVVVTLTGSRKKEDYGYVAVIKDAESILLNQRIARLRCSAGILPTFLEIAMQSKDFRQRFFGYETGNVGQGNVGMTAVTKEPTSLPPLAEQQRIVAEVERRFSIIEQLEAVVNTNLQRATRVRQSILRQAFEGKSRPTQTGRSCVKVG
jgi:type I restriction enzyme S subunit